MGLHFHACRTCGEAFACQGEHVWRDNADGEPKAVCLAFHVALRNQCALCRPGEPAEYEPFLFAELEPAAPAGLGPRIGDLAGEYGPDDGAAEVHKIAELADRLLENGSRCRFCGGDGSEADHARRCDGRQGRAEVSFPPFISGATVDTWGTSAAAAAAIEPGRGTQRARVFLAIVLAGGHGCTDDEVQAALGLEGSSERPRRRELETLAAIVPLRDASTGLAVRRLTRTGRRAVVWIDARLVSVAVPA